MPQFHSKIKPVLSPAAPKDNITQILNQLCSEIGLKTWESEMLIAKCFEKKCADQLFSFLEQYLVHVKRLNILVKNYLELSNKLKLWHELLAQNVFENGESSTFLDHIGQVALCIAKLMYTMCSLRLYQESPRPLRYNIEQTSDSEVLSDGAIIVLEVLRQDASKIAKLLKSNRNILHYALSNIPAQHLALVLQGNFEDVLLGHVPPTTVTETARLVSSIASFLSVEDRIDSTWWSVRMMNLSNAVTSSTQSSFSPSTRSFSFKGSSINLSKSSFGFKNTKTASFNATEMDPYDLYPVLRLPYTDESRLPLDILSWFVGASDYYSSLKDQIVKEMHDGTLSRYKNSPSKEKPVVAVASLPEQHKVLRHVTIAPLVHVTQCFTPSSSPLVINSSNEIDDSSLPLLTRVKPINKVTVVQQPSSSHESMPRSVPTSPSQSSSPQKSVDRNKSNYRSNVSPKARPATSDSSSNRNASRPRRNGDNEQQNPSPKSTVKPAEEEISIVNYATQILNEIVETAVLQGIVNIQLRRKWTREVSRCMRLYRRELAAVRIQRLYRRYFWKKVFLFARKKLAEKRMLEAEEQHNHMQQHISRTLSTLHVRQQQRYAVSLQTLTNIVRQYMIYKRRKRCAVSIQRVYRGHFVRKRTLLEVLCTIKLIKCFKRRASLNTLKLKLQRHERPIFIKLSSLSGIPAAVCASGEAISYRISIWWTPLLHILSLDDTEIFTQHNNPQAIITSPENEYDLTTPPKVKYADGKSNSPPRRSRTSSLIKTGLRYVQEVVGASSSDLTAASQRNHCILDNSEFCVPSCHGNAVIKIDFFFGSKRFASSKFILREEIRKGGLLFWGGHYERPVQLITHRHDNIYRPSEAPRTRKNRSPSPLSPTSSNKEEMISVPGVALTVARRAPIAPRKPSINKENQTILRFSVMAGPPCRSKSSSAKVRLSGGKNYIYRKFIRNNVIGTILGHWDKLFLMLNHNGLNFHASRKNFVSLCSISTDTFSSVETVAALPTKVVGLVSHAKSKVLFEDNVDVILKVSNGEEVIMRFADLRTRCSWVETLTNVINHEVKLKQINSGMTRVPRVTQMYKDMVDGLAKVSARLSESVRNKEILEETLEETLEEDDSTNSEC